MKNFSKAFKIASLSTALLMVFTFTGCRAKVNDSNGGSSSDFSLSGGQNEVNSGNDDTQTSDSPVDSSTDQSSGSSGGNSSGGGIDNIVDNNNSYKETVYDLKGRTITIASENDLANAGTIFKESVQLTEKKYNCKFKFIHKTDYFGLYQTLINDHASGTATYDVIELRGYDVYPNAATSGAIRNLSKDYDFAGDPTWNNSVFGTIGKFKGNVYGIPYTPNEVGKGIWYNRALLRAANVPDLWEYYNNNTWNFDTFRAVCKKLTRDTNGDGTPDVWAFTSEDPWLDFVTVNGGELITMTSSGPKYSLTSDKAITALNYVNTLFADNTVPDGKELGAITDSPFNAMTTGKVAMFSYHARYGAVLESYNIPSSDIGWIFLPKGPDAKSYTTATGTAPGMFVIPQAVSDAKEVVSAVQDLAAYWDTSREVRRKVTDKTDELYEALKTSLDANAKKVLYYQAENAEYTYTANYGIGTILQNEVWPEILNGKSPKTVVNSYASKIQKQLTASSNGTSVS